MGEARDRLFRSMLFTAPLTLCLACGSELATQPDARSPAASTAGQGAAAPLSCSTNSLARSNLQVEPSPPAAHETSGSGDFPPPPEPPGVSGSLEVRPRESTIRLHYPLDGDPYGDCQAHAWLQRVLPACTEPLDYAIRTLLSGPTPTEVESRSLVDSTRGRGAPLADSFLGVSLTSSGVAVLEFSAPAMMYLNQAACAQVSVKSALLRTATQFAGVVDIAFVVDGELVTEWDA